MSKTGLIVHSNAAFITFLLFNVHMIYLQMVFHIQSIVVVHPFFVGGEEGEE